MRTASSQLAKRTGASGLLPSPRRKTWVRLTVPDWLRTREGKVRYPRQSDRARDFCCYLLSAPALVRKRQSTRRDFRLPDQPPGFPNRKRGQERKGCKRNATTQPRNHATEHVSDLRIPILLNPRPLPTTRWQKRVVGPASRQNSKYVIVMARRAPKNRQSGQSDQARGESKKEKKSALGPSRRTVGVHNHGLIFGPLHTSPGLSAVPRDARRRMPSY